MKWRDEWPDFDEEEDEEDLATERRDIGTIGNYYGGLIVYRDEDGVCWWGIENYNGTAWEAISLELFAELNSHQDTLDNKETNHERE